MRSTCSQVIGTVSIDVASFSMAVTAKGSTFSIDDLPAGLILPGAPLSKVIGSGELEGKVDDCRRRADSDRSSVRAAGQGAPRVASPVTLLNVLTPVCLGAFGTGDTSRSPRADRSRPASTR